MWYTLLVIKLLGSAVSSYTVCLYISSGSILQEKTIGILTTHPRRSKVEHDYRKGIPNDSIVSLLSFLEDQVKCFKVTILCHLFSNLIAK